jgi:hypothetical protein
MSTTAPSIQAAPAANGADDRAGEVVIGVSGLHKRYGELEAVRGIDLQVMPNAVRSASRCGTGRRSRRSSIGAHN